MITQNTFFYQNCEVGRKEKTDVSAKTRGGKTSWGRRDQEADNKSVWHVSRSLGLIIFSPKELKAIKSGD